MDEIVYCPKCHHAVDSVDYFCRNCGKKLHSPPLSTSLSSLISVFLKTIFLPPLGLVWGFKYLRQSDTKSKLVGFFIIGITIIEVVWLIQLTINAVNTVNQQISEQMDFLM